MNYENENINEQGYSWNDPVIIKKLAPKQFYPGEIGIICGMSKIEFEEIAKKYYSKVGDWTYTLEFENGTDIQIAGCYLEKLPE